MEECRVMCSSESFQELCHGRRQTVINLVARSPKSVSSCFRQSVNLEYGIIGGNMLKCNISVPAYRGETRCVAKLMSETAAFFLLLTANQTNLITQLASLFRQRMDMQ